MTHHRESGWLTRRSFLRAAGVVVGTLGVPDRLVPTQARASVPAPQVSRRGDAFRLGVLLPRSGIYPQLGASLLAGLELCLEQMQRTLGGRPVELVIREFAGSGLRAEQAIESLLSERVSLIAGVVNPRVSGMLRGRLAAERTPLLAVGAGENIARAERHDEWVVHNSLSGWQSAWAMGTWAASNLGTRAIIAASLYDSGYDSLYAFRQGFENAGGMISAALITHGPHDRDALPQAIATIGRSRPDFVYGAYCGRQAIEFVQAYASAGLTGSIPLAASAFMVDEQILASHGSAALGITSCLPWAPDLKSARHQVFASDVRARTGHPPDAFTLLGYEVALLIAEAARVAGGVEQRDRLAVALQHVQFQSPRGSWQSDSASRAPITPIYLREVQRAAGGLSNTVLGEMALPSSRQAVLAELQRSPKSGWTNPYLCV